MTLSNAASGRLIIWAAWLVVWSLFVFIGGLILGAVFALGVWNVGTFIAAGMAIVGVLFAVVAETFREVDR